MAPTVVVKIDEKDDQFWSRPQKVNTCWGVYNNQRSTEFLKYYLYLKNHAVFWVKVVNYVHYAIYPLGTKARSLPDKFFT
jgi:hypothetical protein